MHTLGSGIGKTLAHGVVGGISSVAQGGKFGSGFLAGGFTQAASPLIGTINPTHVGPDIGRTVAAAVVGGTASVLGGGKFANGAVTGAFSRLFNDDAVERSRRINQPSSGSITFENDVAARASPDQLVNPRLATAVEDIVGATGMDVNINSTVRGAGPHAEGRAVDINRINGMRVDNALNVDNVRTLQEALMAHPNVNQVLGPVHNVNIIRGVPVPITHQILIDAHRNHLHINVPR